MTRSRLEVDYKEYLEILRLYLTPSEKDPRLSKLDQLIKDRIEELETPYKVADLNNHIKRGSYHAISKAEQVTIAKDSDVKLYILRKQKAFTADYLSKCDTEILKAIVSVYIKKEQNIPGVAMNMLYTSERTAYRRINKWLEGYREARWSC